MAKETNPENKTPALNIKMAREEYDLIKAIAKEHKRSLASYVRDVLIANDIEKHKAK